MKYKKVDRIQEKLSVIGFGCWGISGASVWNKSDDDNSIKAIHSAIDLGVNLFDVAPVYGLGHAEEVLGRALANGKREKVVIATKCGLVWDQKNNVTNNLKKESIFREVDQSLNRLKTDYIDIYQLHWPDPNTEIEETMEAMGQLIEMGKIKYVGLTNFPLSLIQRAEKCLPLASQQGLYNMLERNPKTYHGIPLGYQTEKEILPYVKEKGEAFFPYSPLFQGLLTGSFNPDNNFDQNDVRASNPKLNGSLFKKYYSAVEELKAVAREIGKPLNEVALNWLIEKEEVTSIISGALSEEQVRSNAKAAEWKLTQDYLERINHILDAFVDEE